MDERLVVANHIVGFPNLAVEMITIKKSIGDVESSIHPGRRQY